MKLEAVVMCQPDLEVESRLRRRVAGVPLRVSYRLETVSGAGVFLRVVSCGLAFADYSECWRQDRNELIQSYSSVELLSI